MTTTAKAKRAPAVKLTLTERKLTAMLTESTGVAMMDSGGTNGRHWQRNQGRDFKAEPASILDPVAEWVEDGRDYEPSMALNVFHFLNTCLEYDDAMNRRYQRFAKPRRADDYESTICEDFIASLKERGEVAGIYGEGEPLSVNTYNGEDLLSQVLQYHFFSFEGDEFVLLQIHQGADVRGGYTDVVAFRHSDNAGVSIWDNAKATIVTEAPTAANGELFEPTRRGLWERPFWSTDDAWNWYRDGSSAGRKLNDYPISRNPEHKGDGEHVFVDADGAAHCPETGLKLLSLP